MMSQEYAWLTGRELLISEIEVRVEAMRTEAAKAPGFRAGLLVFLERRLARVKSVLGTLRHLPSAVSEGRRQTVDRMVSAIIGTLRHAEFSLRGESGVPNDRERDASVPERRREERRQYPSRRGGHTPVPAGEEAKPDDASGPDRDQDAADGI
jgi:hypothetical protein